MSAFASADYSGLTLSTPKPGKFVFMGKDGPLVTMYMDEGRVEFGPDLTRDDATRAAAELFWRTFMAHLDGRRNVYVVTTFGFYAGVFRTRQEAEEYIRTEYGGSEDNDKRIVQQRV